MSALHVVCSQCGGVNRLPAEKLSAGGKCGKCHSSLLTGQPAELTFSTFDQFISRNDLPVVVDFWAPWCGPCKMMAPVFSQAAEQLRHRALLAKVNTENEQQLAAQYQIRSIPTVAVYKQGREVIRQPGAMDLQSLLRWINPHL